MKSLARVAILVAAAALSVASGTSGSDRRPDPAPGLGGGGAAYHCHAVQGETGVRSSICRATPEECEREREASAAAGLRTSVCTPVSPVACFPLWGDPSPASEWCAATYDECDYWREVDRQKNQSEPPACEWRH